jgi:uncharacterized protein (DUF4415 family)
MRRKGRIERGTAEDIRRRLAAGEDKSDWKAARAIPQAQAERLADEEEGLLPKDWEATVELGIPEPKQEVHIRLDPAVLRWFRSQGPGYQTRINSVLRSFVRAREREEARSKAK